MALLVQAVIEREVRLAMVKNGLKTVPIYPETKECEMPTTSRMLELFSLMELHKLWSDGKLMKVFRTELDDIQKQVLFLAGESTDAYIQDG